MDAHAHDSYLAEHLRKALAEDGRVGEPAIRVTIAAGRVWLTGTVGSGERRAAAEALVRELAGEMHVRNDLTVLEVREEPGVETLEP